MYPHTTSSISLSHMYPDLKSSVNSIKNRTHFQAAPCRTWFSSHHIETVHKNTDWGAHIHGLPQITDQRNEWHDMHPNSYPHKHFDVSSTAPQVMTYYILIPLPHPHTIVQFKTMHDMAPWHTPDFFTHHSIISSLPQHKQNACMQPNMSCINTPDTCTKLDTTTHGCKFTSWSQATVQVILNSYQIHAIEITNTPFLSYTHNR